MRRRRIGKGRYAQMNDGNEKLFSIEQILQSTIGNLEWYGEANHDNQVLENMKNCGDYALYYLLDHYCELTKNARTNSGYGSAVILGKYAYDVLKDVQDMVNNAIDNYERKETV